MLITVKASKVDFHCRYELIDILRNNNFNTPDIRNADVYVSNKRAKQTQRRILKGFNISTVDIAIREAFANDGKKSGDFFKTIAQAISNKGAKKLMHPSEIKGNEICDPIGSTRRFQVKLLNDRHKNCLKQCDPYTVTSQFDPQKVNHTKSSKN